MADVTETLDRTALARDRLAEITTRHLTNRMGSVVEAVQAIMELAAELGHVRVSCREDGDALTIRYGRDPEAEVELKHARSLLRMMCGHLAVRAAETGKLPNIHGGITFLPPVRPDLAGYTLKMMNTTGEHWFDLGYHGGMP